MSRIHIRIAPLALPVAVAASLLCAPASAALVVTKASDLGLLGAPITLAIGTAFNDGNPAMPGIQLSGGAGTLLPADTFYEGYGFQIDGAAFGSIAASLNLGGVFQLSNLQLNLYEGTLGSAAPGPLGAGVTSPWASTALIATGVANGNAQEISFVELPAGDYVLEITGNIAGTSGGSYAGTISLHPLAPPEVLPVPEPESIGLVALGLLSLLGLRRRRA